MFRLFQILFDGCLHRWKIHREVRLLKEDQGIPYGIKYIMQCEKCGKMTTWTDH